MHPVSDMCMAESFNIKANMNSYILLQTAAIFKGLPTTSEDLPVFVVFLIFKVCRLRRKTFLFFCFLFLLFFLSFLFFSTADFLQRFLSYFSTDLDQIWHVHSPWWDEEPKYNFKSIGPGVWTGRGPKVLLCFIIGKTLYTVRRDKNFTKRRIF